VHGPRDGDRRVVLDEATLEAHEKRRDIRVFPPKVLLERFLATLRSEMEAAQKLSQPVLLLIFGHGDEDTHGVSIGGDSQDNAPRLTRGLLQAELKSNVDVTLFITSCFSGGWVIKPKYSRRPAANPKPQFNITAISAAGANNMSLSWATSLSANKRAGGGIMATCAVKALIAKSESSRDFNSMCTALENRFTEGPNGEPIEENPTYVDLCKSIHESMVEVEPTSWYNHYLSFAAQDDKWDSEWRTRSGFPLVNYRQRWEILRPIQPGVEVIPKPQSQSRTGGSFSSHQLHGIVRNKALAYMYSSPGDDNSGGNSCHRRCNLLIENEKQFSDKELRYLSGTLDYRMDMMDVATQFATYMGIKFPKAYGFDTKKWFEANSTGMMSLSQNSPDRAKSSQAKVNRYTQIFDYIMGIRLFDLPLREQGPGYAKPKEFLAIALTESGAPLDEIKLKINKAKIGKPEPADLPLRCLTDFKPL